MITIVTDKNIGDMFEGIDITTTTKGFSYHKADAIVSAANSFGIMDGGSDTAIIDIIGSQIGLKLRRIINTEYYNEVPVGQAVAIQLDHQQYDYLISAPTMRIPKDISNTDNVYQAMRAVLKTMKQLNLTTLIMPLFGTGYGQMDSRMAAWQIRLAYLSMNNNALSFEDIHKSEYDIYNTKEIK